MMDVDQPVSSTTDTNEKEEGATLDAVSPSSQENADAKSPGLNVRENDDLPPLLISDSEEENDQPKPPPSPPPSKAPTEEVQASDISGISPIETTVANVQDEKSVTGEDVGSDANADETVQETSLQPAADKAGENLLMENIDLTGASSADDSGVSEESISERITTTNTTNTISRSPVVTPKAATKPSSEMTAQELLESLLGAQEEAFASHRESELGAEPERKETDVESKSSEEVGQKDTTSEAEKITNNNLESSSTLLQDGQDVAEENANKMDTVVIDDECLLEEMSNVPTERQQEMDIDDHHTGSSNSSCSADGLNHISDGAEQDKNDEADAGVGKTDNEDSEEPPRKRARSMDVIEDSTIETTEPPFHGIEHDTVQNDTRSDELVMKSDNLKHEKEKLDTKRGLNLSETEPKLTVDSLEPKSTSANDSCSSASANSGSLKKSCIEVGGQQNVKPVEPLVCPDVLVIDDDDDEDDNAAAGGVSCNSKLSPKTSEMKQDAPEESELGTVQTSDNNSDVRLSPVPPENMEPEPIAMEFLRKFCKPLSQMTRTDLEQLVLQKITEAIVHRSETAELRRIVKRQSTKLQNYERTIADMNNHYEGLKLVAERAVMDMKKRAKSFVAPVKITRAVGLQVSRPTTDTISAHKLAQFSKMLSAKRKEESGVATVTTTTNGAPENGGQNSSSEVTNRMTQPSATAAAASFSGGHPQNTSAHMNRSQFSNSMSATNASRFITSNCTVNGMSRSTASPNVKYNNGSTGANVSITPGNPARLTENIKNDVSLLSTPLTATLAGVSPKTGSASATPNSVAVGGVDSPVRKKFHKFTPKRPPLSPYQQAQQEKQVKQQQELLVQQIHAQSRQNTSFQLRVRQDVLPAAESSSIVRTTAQMDASVNRPRPMPPNQSRLLNATNSQAPATQNYQVVSYGAIRPVASSTLTSSSTATPLQPSEVQKPNSQPTSAGPIAAATPPVNGSLIDLTDEDDTSASSIYIKRAKISHSGGPFTSSPAPSNPSSSVQAIAANQLVRIQHRINTVDGGADTVVSVVGTNSSDGVGSLYNGSSMARAQPPVNRPNNAPALQPIRHPVSSSHLQRLPATTGEMVKKRVVNKPQLAPLPNPGPQPSDPSWKLPPPHPVICVNNVETGIVISWTMPSLTKHHSNIETYQIYAYQEPSVQSASEEWRHVGDVKALLLPMAVTLTQFHEGQRYYFAVRAIDMHKRIGKFCEPRTWQEV